MKYARIPSCAGPLFSSMVFVIGSSPAFAQVEPETDDASRRVVHQFDFDERSKGNLEDIPKYWLPLRPKGFPRFARGSFDESVGHDAPPSFHLAAEGRNVAYQYSGPETRVRPNTDYRIEGYVRPDQLRYARACLSAHYVDKQGNPILSTLVRSRYLGGPEESDGWIRVEIYLPSAGPQAYTIGLIGWILQEPMWTTSVPERRHISRTDVKGGAWLDDIMIFALPRTHLTTSSLGNVLAPDSLQELRVVLADDEDAWLRGQLTITNMEDEALATHAIPVRLREPVEPTRIPLDYLEAGVYQASLDVFTQTTWVMSRTLKFAKLAALNQASGSVGKSFGVVLDPQSRSDTDTELALLGQLAARSVKIPIWSGGLEEPSSPAQRREADRFLQQLVQDGFSLTGVFLGPPSAIVRGDGAYDRSLFDMLKGDPDEWKEHLAAVVAPNANVFGWWQIGADGTIPLIAYRDLNPAVTQLREGMLPFVIAPRLALPTSTAVEPPPNGLPVQQLAITLGEEVPTQWLRKELERFKAPGYEHLSAFVEPLPVGPYRRFARLAKWAQRILTTRHTETDTVFVPQTWNVRETIQGKVTEPTEEYILLRTMASVLGDAPPGHRLRLPPGVEGLAFYHDAHAVLALWDTYAPPGGRSYAIQLGQADRQIDLWGGTTRMDRDEHGRQIVRLSSMPVLVDQVDRWLIELRASLALTPSHVESGVELARHTLEITHRGRQPIAGTIQFAGPHSWEITPRSHYFTLMPHRTTRLPLEVHYSHNEPTGTKEIIAKIRIPTESVYLEVALPIEIGLSDVEVSATVGMEGSTLVLQHRVTNRSDSVLHFRGTAVVPARPRQYRPIPNLKPGDTQTVVYQFPRSRHLQGTTVRLGLREMNDGPRTHTLELLVP